MKYMCLVKLTKSICFQKYMFLKKIITKYLSVSLVISFYGLIGQEMGSEVVWSYLKVFWLSKNSFTGNSERQKKKS